MPRSRAPLHAGPTTELCTWLLNQEKAVDAVNSLYNDIKAAGQAHPDKAKAERDRNQAIGQAFGTFKTLVRAVGDGLCSWKRGVGRAFFSGTFNISVRAVGDGLFVYGTGVSAEPLSE